MVFRTNTKTTDEVNLIFVTANHSDGRSAFRRARTKQDFDFGDWFNHIAEGWDDPDDAVERLCTTAERAGDCQNALKRDGLKASGTAVKLRLGPAP